MQDDLIEAMAENIRYDPRTPWIADSDLTFIARAAYAVITDRIAALEAKLAEKDALLRECVEGLAGPNAWLERWASHVGGCHGGSLCQCGLTLARLESATTLAKIKDTTDAD